MFGTTRAHSSCTLATTGLTPVDAAVLTSMLGLLKDRTSRRWQLGEPQQADFLLVGTEPEARVLASWQASGKPWIAAMRATDARPPAEHTLPLPFRMFPLLTLLQELEHLPGMGHGHAAPAPTVAASGNQWCLAQALHDARLQTSHGAWRRAGSIYLRDDACAYATDAASLEALRSGTLPASTFDGAVVMPPPGFLQRPVEELTWFVGWWADGTQLAPWLSPDAHHRLRQWPDFGSLQASQVQLRLAALLAAGAWTLDNLVDGRGFARELAIRFMNAASLSGLLIESEPEAPPPAPRPTGFLAKLLDGMRARLGLQDGIAPARRGGCGVA